MIHRLTIRYLMIGRLALAASLALASCSLFATTYTLEPDYTQGVFRWNHLGFSSPAAQFAQGQGTLEYDQSDPSHSSVEVTIPLSTLNTGVPALDDDFRSTDFFDTPRFPTATFKSTRVVKDTAMNRLKVTGDLTLHGVTKRVTIPVQALGTAKTPNGEKAGFEALFTLNRKDYGITWNRVLDAGGTVLGEDVKVTIQIEASRQTVPASGPK
jgi:polyisoprenoid-binding protein YceI